MKIGDTVRLKDNNTTMCVIGMMPMDSPFAHTWPTTYTRSKGAYVVLAECPTCGHQKEIASQLLEEVSE